MRLEKTGTTTTTPSDWIARFRILWILSLAASCWVMIVIAVVLW